MKAIEANPYEALERIFHEPNRLAIMSALAAAPDGLTFTELRERCRLTDGNLSRHLKALDEAGAVVIEKEFVESKPRTTIYLSKHGSDRFMEYLAALEQVLKDAAKAFRMEEAAPRSSLTLRSARPARA
jgi:DNA-binding transcriptional ArsR family regulator